MPYFSVYGCLCLVMSCYHSQVERLLATRVDVLTEYGESQPEASFDKYFKLHQKDSFQHSKRTLHLFKNKIIQTYSVVKA